MPALVAIENFLVAAVTVFAFALTVIGAAAFRRARDSHLLLLAIAFGLFFAKGLVLTAALFLTPIALPTLILVWGAFDLLILAFFYAFTLRR